MTALAEAKREARAKFRELRVTFDSGATARWGTAWVHTPTGRVEGRLLATGRARSIFPERQGDRPENASFGFTLDNSDRALNALLIGTTGAVATEYSGDGVLNLKAQLFACFIDEDGGFHELALTPEMVCAATVEFDETTVELSLSNSDDAVLGDVQDVVTVRQLRDATWKTAGVYALLDPGTTYALGEEGHLATMATVVDSLETVIPFAYPQTPLELIRFDEGQAGDIAGVLFVSKFAVDISDAAQWEVFRKDFDGAEEVARQVTQLRTAELTFLRSDGTTIDLWVVYAIVRLRGSYDNEKLWFLAPVTNCLSAYDTELAGRPFTPTEIARTIVRQHSLLGAAGINDASFNLVAYSIGAGFSGGLVRGGARIAELLALIGEPFGLIWQIGTDGKLMVFAPNAWNDADVSAVAAGIPHLRHGVDVFNYRERIPREIDARGSAVNKAFLEWSPEQQAFYPASMLPTRAAGNTSLPLGPVIECRVRGDWVNARIGRRALQAVLERRSFPTRRFLLSCSDHVGLLARGQLVVYTHRLAAGTTSATGYQRRLARFEGGEDGPDHVFVAEFEDLGAVADMKPAVYDTIDNWIRYDPTGDTGKKITFAIGSTTVTCTGWDPSAAGLEEGDELHAIGAVTKRHRAAVFIFGGPTATTFEIEFAATANETVMASAAADPIDTNWLILKSQATKTPWNTTKLTVCDEAAEQFRDLSQGFQYSNG